ncbi:hypothetical protein KIN20_035539 [Parelaphostrongylus tenuis]|uniref:Uncharacterized protein n=1 Tax=Parelaphostrongylus tenuis TaxID=148309 RepID=A0AAD5WK09_PARTN|nr:hypothetical protein KIN20_035539 [Parelaphostrongylus tenuis]
MLGASSLDPSSSSSASPWHSNSASASSAVVGHPPSNTNSRHPSSSAHSPPEAQADFPTPFAHVNVKEEFSHLEPVASTSGSGEFEENAPFETDESRRHSMTTSSSVPSVHCRRLTFRLPPKFAQRLKRIANKQPSTLGRLGVAKVKVGDDEAVSVNDVPPPVQHLKVEERRPSEQPVERSEPRPSGGTPQLQSTAQTSGLMCQPPGYHTMQHPQEVGPAVAPHPMQRPPPVNNNSPLLVNLLSSQQQTSMVGGPSNANMPPHHQSYSSAGSYMYPASTQPHQHPHPSNVPQSAGPPVMDPQQHMAMQQQIQMDQRQRMMMQQQQAHAAAVAAAQAQQHPGQVQGQALQVPLTSGGFYNSAPPVQSAPPQQRPPAMGYATTQSPMFAGQPQMPQQVPVNIQQQRIQSYPAHLKSNNMPITSPVASAQFRGPPVEETVQPPPPKKKRKPTKKQQQKEAELAAAAAAQQQQNAAAQAQQQQQFYTERMMHPAAMAVQPSGMQIMTHSGYPPGTAFPANPGGISAVPAQYPGYPQGSSQQQIQQQQQQQHIWHQQMQQRMMYQQQHVQPPGPNSAHTGQSWPAQRGPPVPYPTPLDGMHSGPDSVHPSVSQRTSGSGEFSRDGTSPATPHQFNPGSHQGMMMRHSSTPMSRADSQGSMFGGSSYGSQQPQTGGQSSVEEVEHPVDKLFTGQDDHLCDLGDLDDIEPMVDLGAGLLDDLTANPQGSDALGTLSSHIAESSSIETSQCGTSSASNGDRIDSSIASVVEMVSKSGAPPSVCVAPAISQTGTHASVVSAPITSVKRRPSNAQMAANIVAVAGQQQHLMTDQRYTIGGSHPHHMITPGQMSGPIPMIAPLATSPSSGNLSLEHNARAQIFHGRTGITKIGENGPGRLVNGHDQTGLPNGARRPQPATQHPDTAEDERIAELVKKVVAQGESQKAAAEQKARIPRKNRRKTDLSKEASPRDDEEPFIVDGSRRRTGVATSHVQAAASNFQATMARQQQLIKQQQIQPKQ